ncbi:MAG: glycogen/starch synthase [Cloacibacillus evryensis]
MEKEHEFVLKILHVSPECAPLAKKGGLGDVAGALPKALRKNDIDARVLMPAWPGVLDRARELSALPSRPLGTVSAALNWRSSPQSSARLYRWASHLHSGKRRAVRERKHYPEEMSAATAEPMIFSPTRPLNSPARALETADHPRP